MSRADYRERADPGEAARNRARAMDDEYGPSPPGVGSPEDLDMAAVSPARALWVGVALGWIAGFIAGFMACTLFFR